MSRNWAQGIYEVLNPNKYVGKRRPRYRSGWEMSFMRFCDTNPNVIQWASEAIQIPYRNPVTGKLTHYVPDFLITYRDRNNTLKAELIEIKPRGQATITEGQRPRDRAVVAVNMAKWHSATLWCRKQGISFRVITEDHMFRNGSK